MMVILQKKFHRLFSFDGKYRIPLYLFLEFFVESTLMPIDY